MNPVILNIFKDYKLSENFQSVFIKLFEKYQHPVYGHINIGEAIEITKVLMTLEKDLEKFNFDLKTYMAFVYYYVHQYLINDFKENNENIFLWERMYRILINDVIFNDDNRKRFLELDNPQTGLMEYLKKVAVLLDELWTLIEQEKNYLATKKFQELIEVCNNYGINPDLLEKGNENKLREALERRFPKSHILSYPHKYRKHLKKRSVSHMELKFTPNDFVYYETFEKLTFMIQRQIYASFMHEFYYRTDYFVKPLNRNINLYYLDDLVVVAYRFDNDPNMALLDNQTILTWNDPGFWGTIFNFKKDFENKGQNKHYIEELNKKYIIEPITFKDSLFRTLGKNVIFAPEKYLDEAVFKYAIVNKCLDKYQEAGLNTNNITNKLLTCNYQFYFKDPTLVDELEVENLGDYKYLEMIRAADATGEERKRTIAGIKGLMKKNPQKVVSVDTSKSNQRQLSFEPRLPYKN